MQELSVEFAKKGVALIGIDSNRQDAITEIDAFARQNSLTFPILKDVGNRVADQFGATRTPEAFFLDAQGTVRYQGRIDDQFSFGAGVGYAQPQLKRKDLANAVDEVLAGKPVTVATTECKGCIIGRIREPQKDSPVTYSNQIARLFNARCVSCHRPGEIGPFAMTKYEEVAGWGEMIAEVVREQRMPPWHANPALRQVRERECSCQGRKRNDLRLGRSRLSRGKSRRAAARSEIHRRLAARRAARRGRLHVRKARRHEGGRSRALSLLHGRSGLQRG